MLGLSNTNLIDTVADELFTVSVDVRNVGESNQQTTLQDVARLPGELTSLNDSSGNIADIVRDGGLTGQFAAIFAQDTADNLDHAGDQTPAETANIFVKDFHLFLENVSHTVGVPFTVHGVTTLGEVIGLGNIGDGGDLVDDTIGPLLGGPGSFDLAAISNDLADISDRLGGPLEGLVADLGSDNVQNTGLLGDEGIVGGSGLDLGRLPDLLSQDNGTFGPVSEIVDNVTNSLDGLGGISDGNLNLVTDALNVPEELLQLNCGQIFGFTPSLSDAGKQVDTTVKAAGDFVESILDADPASTSPAGSLGSITGALGIFGDEAGPAIGIPQTLDTVIGGLGGAHANPGDVAGGVVDSLVSDLKFDIDLADGLPFLGHLGGGDADDLIGALAGGSALGDGIPLVGGLVDGLDVGNLGGLAGLEALPLDVGHDLHLPIAI
jgi:hypothetical protein